jgi:ATP-binding cassette, subfamily B, bacterial MsbA
MHKSMNLMSCCQKWHLPEWLATGFIANIPIQNQSITVLFVSRPCKNNKMSTDSDLLKRLLTFVRPYSSRLLAGSFCLAMVSVIEPLIVIVFSRIIDRGFAGGASPTGATNPLTQSQLAKSFLAPLTQWLDSVPVLWFPVFLVIVFAFRSTANFLGDVALHWVSSRVVFDLRRATFAHLLRLPATFFDKNATAALTSKITFDAQQIGAASSQALTTLVQDSLKLVFALTLLATVSWKLTLGVFFIAPVVAAVVRALTKRLRAASESMQHSMGELSRFTDETLSNQRSIKIFAAYSAVAHAFLSRANAVRRSLMKQETANAASAPLIHIVVSVAIAIIVAFAIEQGQRGEMSVGDFITFFMALLSLLPPLKSLSSVNSVIQRGLAAASSLFTVIDHATEKQSATVQQKLVGEIEFRGVSFRYADRDVDALVNVSFKIAAGTRVAFVGSSGSGKTTALSLLAGFYAPSTGEILVDGIPTQQIGLSALRANLSLVSQDVLLISDSVARNIAFGDTNIEEPNAYDTINQERVQTAALAAGADVFVRALPSGYETNVGEDGGLLSGGQRQRIAIARAFYKNTSIVLFDEATSALDTQSEQVVQESLRALGRGRTVVQIAHRLSSIRDVDEILVFDRGHVVERGTHETLLSINGVYAALIKGQVA